MKKLHNVSCDLTTTCLGLADSEQAQARTNYKEFVWTQCGSVLSANWFGAIRVSSYANIAYAIYTRGDIEQYFPGHPASSLR